jgi:hypothetical protein
LNEGISASASTAPVLKLDVSTKNAKLETGDTLQVTDEIEPVSPGTTQLTMKHILLKKETFPVVLEYMTSVGKASYVHCWSNLIRMTNDMKEADAATVQRGVMDMVIEFFTPGCTQYVDFDSAIVMEWKNNAMLNPSPSVFWHLQEKLADFMHEHHMFGFKRSMLFEKVVQAEMRQFKRSTMALNSKGASTAHLDIGDMGRAKSRSLDMLSEKSSRKEVVIQDDDLSKSVMMGTGLGEAVSGLNKSSDTLQSYDEAMVLLQRQLDDLDEMIQGAADDDLRRALSTTKQELEREIQEYVKMIQEEKEPDLVLFKARINIVQMSNNSKSGPSKSLFSSNNEPTQLYMIEIEGTQNGWMVTKSYSEFNEMHQALRQDVGSAALGDIKFPSRQIFKNNDSQLLTKYLSAILNDKQLSEASSVQSFLRPANYQPPARKKKIQDIVKSAASRMKPFKNKSSSDKEKSVPSKSKKRGTWLFRSSDKSESASNSSLNDAEQQSEAAKEDKRNRSKSFIDASFMKKQLQEQLDDKDVTERPKLSTSLSFSNDSRPSDSVTPSIAGTDDEGNKDKEAIKDEKRGRKQSTSVWTRRSSKSVESPKTSPDSPFGRRRSVSASAGKPGFAWKADFDNPSPSPSPEAKEDTKEVHPTIHEDTKESDVSKEKVNSTRELTDEEVELMLEALFALVEEVFLDQSQRSQWLRRKALNVIKQLLRQSFGTAINSVFTEKIHGALTEDTALLIIHALTNSCWPKGTWPTPEEAQPPRTDEEKEATKLEAKTLLMNAMPDSLQRALGFSNCSTGLSRLFNLFQHQELNASLVLGLLDRLTKLVFAEKIVT